MDSYATKFRYVKCPKCLELLTEFAHIPVYKCGGCGKVLQSKFYNANVGNVISGSVDANQARILQSIESSNDVLIRSVKQSVPCSSNAESSDVKERREEEIIVSNLESTSTKAEQSVQKDGSEYVGKNHSVINDTTDSSLDAELEKPLKPGKQGFDSPSISSEQNKVGERAIHNELAAFSRSPSARSYQTYDGSVSSSDDGYSDRVRNRHLSLSRRTIRDQIVLDSADEEEKADALATNVSTYRNQRILYSSDVEGREGANVLGTNGMANDAEENLEVISRRAYRRRRILHSADAKEKEQENAHIESNDMASGSEEYLKGDCVVDSNAIASTFDEHHKADNGRGVNAMSSTFNEHRKGDTVIEANGMSSTFDEHREGDNFIGVNGVNGTLDEHHKGNNAIGANDVSSTFPEHGDDDDSFVGANGMISIFDERHNGDNVLGANYMSSTFHEHCEGDSLIGANVMSSSLDEQNKGDDVIGANGMASTFDVQHKRDMSSSSEGHLEGKSLASNSLKDSHDSAIDGTSDSNVDDLSSEIRTHGRGWRGSVDSDEFYSVQNWLESESGGPSRSTSRGSNFYPDSLQYQNGIPGTKLKSVNNEREELLRKVSELRNQLSGLYDQKVKHSAHLSSNPHGQPMMHPHYSGHQVCYVPQQCQFSRISFSGQSCSSCLHCLPPQSCCHSGPCYSSSHSMSSQSSEAPFYHKPQRGDGYESEKTYGKDKKPRAKRHCLPMLGGAPFVLCTNCSRLLQLPADILISRSKQKLRCGGCSEVIVFLFNSGACTDPLTSAETIHPPCEIENKDDDDPQGDPISFTEEYDLSLDNSCSTEIEIVQNADRRSTGSDKQRAALPLHRLMGYHSARELLKTRLFEQSMEDVYGNLQARERGKVASILNRHSADEAYPSFMQKYDEDQSPNKFKTRKVGAPLQGIVKRGVRELNHGFESLKIKVHGSRRTAPAPQKN